MLIALNGISQTSNDSTKVAIPISQLRKAISIIEIGKVEKEELDLTKKNIEIAEKRLIAKDSVIQLFAIKEKAYISIINNYKQNLSNSDQMVSNLEKSLKLEGKKLKIQKFSKWAALITGLSIGLIITK